MFLKPLHSDVIGTSEQFKQGGVLCRIPWIQDHLIIIWPSAIWQARHIAPSQQRDDNHRADPLVRGFDYDYEHDDEHESYCFIPATIDLCLIE